MKCACWMLWLLGTVCFSSANCGGGGGTNKPLDTAPIGPGLGGVMATGGTASVDAGDRPQTGGSTTIPREDAAKMQDVNSSDLPAPVVAGCEGITAEACDESIRNAPTEADVVTVEAPPPVTAINEWELCAN